MWHIKEQEFDLSKIAHYGNKFLIGHLNLGVRGTLDEFGKKEMVACHLPFVYDQVGHGWREPVNAFNPLYTKLYHGSGSIDVFISQIISHEQILELSTGLYTRKTLFNHEGVQVSITSKRFVNAFGNRRIYALYEVEVNQDVSLTLKTGIDLDIWDLHGPHLEGIKTSMEEYLYASSKTHEHGRTISTAKKVISKQNILSSYEEEDQKILEVFQFDAKANKVYQFYQYAYIGVDETKDFIETEIIDMVNLGFDQAYIMQEKIWKAMWEDADVEIIGDEQAQLALRYSIYHLLILSPKFSEYTSIPARGISGQTYKGAIFWDTEIFMLPFYLNTDLKSAKSIIKYRISGLKGAKEKAKSYGYLGAFFAWESQEDGFDACTDYNVTDVFTNRPVRTYFKDKQIHISGDIVYAIESYIERTKDYKILEEGALELILEVARFYLSYGRYNVMLDRFEILDILGPDEYHERVSNNAFTNQLVSMVFKLVIQYENYFTSINNKLFNYLVKKMDYDKELSLIHNLVNKVYLKTVNEEDIIEQFDGYYRLKDISKDELMSNKLHPNEYLGGSGLAGDTKIIKQADVITMLYLFKDSYSRNIHEKNFHYYEPKTEHGSSLSSSMYALIACHIGKPEYAYPLFMKSATIDITGESKTYAGGIYIGGTHPAASGGAYMTAIYGFAGLKLNETLELEPKLPQSFLKMSFKIKHLGKQYKIDLTKDYYDIKEI